MGIERESRTKTVFRCDIPGCDGYHVEWHGPSFDDARTAAAGAKTAGWHLSRSRGRWEALCSDCNTVNWSPTPEYWD
jgi:hypothetical protein